MVANASLNDYPPVLLARIFQQSNASAGRVIVRAALSDVGTQPLDTTLTCTARGFTGSWDLRRVKSGRVLYDYVLYVFEDSRHVLRGIEFSESYNVRNVYGEIDPSTQRTIPQLWAIIAARSGLSIVVDSSPAYLPTVTWNGTAEEAANDLLRWTGCRMVYDPSDQTYHINEGDTGTVDLSDRRFADAPVSIVKDLIVEAAPTLYEGYLEAEAVVEQDGELVLLTNPIDMFTAWDNIADISDRWRLQQSALRLWRVTGTDHPEALTPDEIHMADTRGVSLAEGDGPLSVDSHAYVEGLTSFPHFQFINYAKAYGTLSLSRLAGSFVYYSDSPILAVDAAGAIRLNTEIVAHWTIPEGDSFRSSSVTVNVNATGSDLNVVVPWIRTLDSELPDADASTWATLHQDVADQMAKLYAGTPQTVSVAAALSPGGAGVVGGVYYEFLTGWRGRVTTTLAFHFIPDRPEGML